MGRIRDSSLTPDVAFWQLFQGVQQKLGFRPSSQLDIRKHLI